MAIRAIRPSDVRPLTASPPAAWRRGGRRFALAAALLSAACGDSSSAPTAPQDPPAAIPVARIALSTELLTLYPGERQLLHAVSLARDGSVLPGRAIAWRSSDPSVATVAASGAVTAIRNGTATIVAFAGGVQASAEVRVNAASPDAALVGAWRMVALQGRALPTPYVTLYDEPVGDAVIGRLEIVIDSAATIIGADATYRRTYWLSEWHDGRRMYRWSWGDYGSWARTDATVSFASAWIQNLRSQGELALPGVMHGVESLWPTEGARPTRWERRAP